LSLPSDGSKVYVSKWAGGGPQRAVLPCEHGLYKFRAHCVRLEFLNYFFNCSVTNNYLFI
jgi:hypothetical protein